MHRRLITAARAAQHQAYSPYSRLKVGAAVQTASGKIYSSGNVENCCYALTICAERGALYHAIACGEHRFRALAVTNSESGYTLPCGACRQVLWELAGDIDIFVANGKGRFQRYRLKDLYPQPYKKQAHRRLLVHRKTGKK